MTEEFWRNSQFSIARFYGQIRICGQEYVILNKYGQTIFETSIPAGDPADLVRKDFVGFYKKLGRDRFIQILKDNSPSIAEELKKVYKAAVDEMRPSAKGSVQAGSLFDD